MPLTPEELATIVTDYRRECDDGHARIRVDFRTYHDQTDTSLVLLRDGLNTLRSRVELIERTPPDVTKLRFSTGVVVSIIAVTLSIAGTGYGVGHLVMGRIDALSARMDENTTQQKQERESTAKLLEERSQVSQRSIDALTRQMELLKYEQQRLREDVTGTKGAKR